MEVARRPTHGQHHGTSHSLGKRIRSHHEAQYYDGDIEDIQDDASQEFDRLGRNIVVEPC